ncbi:MAG TPA: hypothetical protein VKQ30_09795 [Ktedonobacterales bacterium]|nr:hypothetical protein [Ktedonobacterales bacterium]
MSQPTRVRTTGGARKPRNAVVDVAPAPVSPASDAAAAAEAASSAPAVASGERPSPSVSAEEVQGGSSFAPEALARTLRAVAAELERDPALARRVAQAVAADSAMPAAAPSVGASDGRPRPPDGTAAPEHAASPTPRLARTFRPKLVSGASPDLGPGIPDPFALYKKLGADDFRTALDELRLGTLRAILREHGLDPKGSLSRQNDVAKLRAAILAAVVRRGAGR